MKRVAFVFGTRPEFIKLYPVMDAMRSSDMEVMVVSTGQHKEMLNPMLEEFDVVPDVDLAIMQPGASVAQITSRALEGVSTALTKLAPNFVVVHGDTATTLSGALAAFYQMIPVGHVEAGLRTATRYSPFPEEMSRRLTTQLTDLHFAPTELAAQNLFDDGVDPASVHVVGNSAVDMLRYTVGDALAADSDAFERDVIAVTFHRRENLAAMRGVFEAIERLARDFPEMRFVFPIHKNPAVRDCASEVFRQPNIELIEPVGPVEFHRLMAESKIILTDSGGIQEEAPSMGIPVLVLRSETERPEGVDAGTLRLVGTDPDSVYQNAASLLTDRDEFDKMAKAKNPYGDGQTSGRIVKLIGEFLRST